MLKRHGEGIPTRWLIVLGAVAVLLIALAVLAHAGVIGKPHL
jgi:hypothetical protein